MAERLTQGGGPDLRVALALTDGRLRALYESGLCVEHAADDPRFVQEPEAVGYVDMEKAANELWKTLCSDCPVWRECLDYAVDTWQKGIWSGTTESRRRKIRNAQARAAARA